MAIITDGVKTKFTDDNGLPLIGGQVFSYVEGTSTPKDTYQDRAFTIPNTNPIILDDVGSCEMYLKGGYRLRVLTADNVLVEEKDNAFQSDGQVLDVVANTTAIAALQTNVDVLNTRGGLKTDENNHIIGQGKAESATVYDLSLRSDKVRVSAPTDVDFGDLVFKTYEEPTVENGVTIPEGTFLNPALVVPLLGTAASKSIGTAAGQVPLSEHVGKIALSDVTYTILTVDVPNYNVNNFAAGESAYVRTTTTGSPTVGMGTYAYVETVGVRKGQPLSVAQWAINMVGLPELAIRNSTSSPWYRVYGSYNTTIDSNGLLKPSSPVLRVFSDGIEGNTDAETMGAIFTKNGVGDYTISNTTGLRTDGWYITIPNDMNGNPKVAVTLEEVGGVVNLKSYKRIFNMNTFTFVPDLEQPLEIPDGRWIDLRFEELPIEPTP